MFLACGTVLLFFHGQVSLQSTLKLKKSDLYRCASKLLLGTIAKLEILTQDSNKHQS